MARKKQVHPRDERMDKRRKQLGLSWDEVAQAARVDRVTVFNIRNGANGHPKTMRNLEGALRWVIGKGISEIDAGREPVEVTDPLATQLAPAAALGDDLAGQLRALRQRMGAAAFWQEIGAMQAEEATLSSSTSAS